MNKSKKLLIVTVIGILCVILSPVKSKAALQSNGGTPAVNSINGWITGIRQMQATGGTLGLTDEINATNLTSTNTELDIHMQKNTEYGGYVLLSASAYGNPNKINDGETTTGNKTGIVMKINKEWVAAGMSNTGAISMKNATGRYKNQYTAPNYTEKVGDAVATAGAWHGANSNSWLGYRSQYNGIIERSCLIRTYSGSIFSYYGWGYDDENYAVGKNDYETYRRDADYRKTWHSRAIIVVGSGI